jgi:XTP/dITP diphosphohydrolase
VPAVTFVSSNPGKAREVRAVLRPYRVDVRWSRRELAEPQADTLEDVVRSKLRATRDLPGTVLVEDSGLFVPSLHGFPGVYSAHFLRIWRFGPLLELLEHRDRRAYFRTVAGLRNGRHESLFVGVVSGRIAEGARGRHGFGYDSIFIPAGWTQTFGEASPEAKNAISHRARAIRKAGRALTTERFPG